MNSREKVVNLSDAEIKAAKKDLEVEVNKSVVALREMVRVFGENSQNGAPMSVALAMALVSAELFAAICYDADSTDLLDKILNDVAKEMKARGDEVMSLYEAKGGFAFAKKALNKENQA